MRLQCANMHRPVDAGLRRAHGSRFKKLIRKAMTRSSRRIGRTKAMPQSQRALSIAQTQHCARVLAQSIREIAPRGFLPVKSFLLMPGQRPIGVKNIQRLSTQPIGQRLRAKAPPPTKLQSISAPTSTSLPHFRNLAYGINSGETSSAITLSQRRQATPRIRQWPVAQRRSCESGYRA